MYNSSNLTINRRQTELTLKENNATKRFLCASHRIASHRIASHRIASHRIASHRIAEGHDHSLHRSILVPKPDLVFGDSLTNLCLSVHVLEPVERISHSKTSLRRSVLSPFHYHFLRVYFFVEIDSLLDDLLM